MKPTEVEWLNAYESWFDGVDASLADGRTASRTTCEATFDDEVGGPPSERLQSTAAAARRGCAALTPARWRDSQADIVRALMVVHEELAHAASTARFVRDREFERRCRSGRLLLGPAAWESFFEHYAIVRGGEEPSLEGVADPARNRIDLGPGICATLDTYLQRIRPLELSSQNLELAEALVVLTHQAEHLKEPSAPETEIECYAIQHVRPLVRAAWGPALAEEIALHGWEIVYPELPPQFRTKACRDGNPLDRNPSSRAWP